MIEKHFADNNMFQKVIYYLNIISIALLYIFLFCLYRDNIIFRYFVNITLFL